MAGVLEHWIVRLPGASVIPAAQGLVHTVRSVTETSYSIPSLPRVTRSTICSDSREPRGWKMADAAP